MTSHITIEGEIPEARCEGRAWLFTSTARRDHEQAKLECHGTHGQLRCPMFDACDQMARDMLASQWQGGLSGTWAGRLYGSRSRYES